MPLMTKVEARRVAPSSLEFPVSCKALEYWEQATGLAESCCSLGEVQRLVLLRARI